MPDDLSEMTKDELMAALDSHDLSTKGTKPALLKRLSGHLDSMEPATPAETTTPSTDTDLDVEAADGDETKDFVKGAYLEILGREADAGGLAHYVTCIDFHGTMSREDCLADLKNSTEAKNR